MTADEARIAPLYAAFNAQAFDRVAAMLAPDVAWPDEAEGVPLRGREAVADYLARIATSLRVRYEPISLHTDEHGAVAVLCRQVVDSATDGSPWSSTRVLHRYVFRDGLVERLSTEQDHRDTRFAGIDALLERVHAAINAGDLEAIVACYAPNARFFDTFEEGVVQGAEGLRAHFRHLLETVRLEIAILDYALEPDDSVRARLQVTTRGADGGLWQDGLVTVWYRLEYGLIVDQDIDDSGV
ncbi:nuclear transport factor 2 family protein [Caulobacter sp.]|uniref:nuclear transport factor 2 family protein n=1 Tax=Caulobacter sp. TaxID=78 RepID=UPI002B475616|nr:nuclear transport factor 2 family protein [Caulobacter sp.]HJV41581.1 nuclear transport factor 2 family protein [Caulobacter sp.]